MGINNTEIDCSRRSNKGRGKWLQRTAGELLRGRHCFKRVNQPIAELVIATLRPEIVRDAAFHEHLIKNGWREVGMHRLHKRCNTRHMRSCHRSSLVTPITISQRVVAITADSTKNAVRKTVRIHILTHVAARCGHINSRAKIGIAGQRIRLTGGRY